MTTHRPRIDLGFDIDDGMRELPPKQQINQQNGTVEVESNTDIDRLNSIHEWSSALQALWKTILSEGDGFKFDDQGSQGASGVGLPIGFSSPSEASGSRSVYGPGYEKSGRSITYDRTATRGNSTLMAAGGSK